MAECEKMMWFKHPNVMSLIGVCFDSGEMPYIVMPFMGNGSLLTYLKRENSHLTVSEEAGNEVVCHSIDNGCYNIPVYIYIVQINDVQRKLLSICFQIAKGMCYLTDKKLIHRDLAARNCMYRASS